MRRTRILRRASNTASSEKRLGSATRIVDRQMSSDMSCFADSRRITGKTGSNQVLVGPGRRFSNFFELSGMRQLT